MKKTTCTTPALLKCARRFCIQTSMKRKNQEKVKLIRKHKNKLTNGQGGMIFHLRTAILERIRNVQIQALQTVFICLISIRTLPTSCCLQ